MVYLCDCSAELSEHYNKNLERYVSSHPNSILILEVTPHSHPAKVSERFYTRREYKRMVKIKRQEFENKVRRGEMQIGGGVIGNSATYEIPRKMPEKRTFELARGLIEKLEEMNR